MVMAAPDRTPTAADRAEALLWVASSLRFEQLMANLRWPSHRRDEEMHDGSRGTAAAA
jgi:hypothetical protein